MTHSYVWYNAFICVTWAADTPGHVGLHFFAKNTPKSALQILNVVNWVASWLLRISARVCCFQWFGSSLMSTGSNLQVWCTSSSCLLQVIVTFDGSNMTMWRFAALWCVLEVLVMFITLYRHMWQSSFWKLSVEYWNTSSCVVKSKGVAYWKSSPCLLQVIVPCVMEIKWQD